MKVRDISTNMQMLLSGRLFLTDDLYALQIDPDEAVQNHWLGARASIERQLFRTICNRCLRTDAQSFGKIDCERCGKKHVYCRGCLMMGRVLECEQLYYSKTMINYPQHKEPLQTDIQLTTEQTRAAESLLYALEAGKREKLVWAVCGAGKTEMLFPLLNSALQKGMRICLASPRKDVIMELAPRLNHAFPDVTIQALYGGSNDRDAIHAQFILSTTHQLIRFYQAFDLMIIDEIDAFPYHKDPYLKTYASRALKEGATTVYLTATPREAERTRIAKNTLPHIFVAKRFHGHPLIVPQLRHSIFLQSSLRAGKLPGVFYKWLTNRQCSSRQLLLFVPTIAMSEALLDHIRSAITTYQLGWTEEQIQFTHAEAGNREETIAAFRKGKVQLLITTTILERGVTFPSVDVAVIDAGHAVFDEAALIQIAGRAGRSQADPTGEVVFFHDGKTKAMLQSIREIRAMNKRGKTDDALPRL